MKINKIFTISTIAIILLATIIIYSLATGSAIWWGKSKLVEKISAGQSIKAPIVFSSNENLGEVSLSVSEDLSRFITDFEPKTLKVTKNKPFEFKAIINIPADTEPGTYGGTIHLKKGKKTIAKPLAVNLIVLPSEPSEPPAPPLMPSWEEPVNISNTSLFSYKPKVIADKLGRVYAFWIDNTRDFSKDYGIHFAKLEGSAWSPAQNIVFLGTSKIYDFDVTVDNRNYLHLAYVTDIAGVGYVFFYTFFDGLSWSSPIQLTRGLYVSLEAGPDNKIHIAYTYAFDVHYAVFDSGSLSSPINITNDGLSNDDNTYGAKAIKIDRRGNIHISWSKHNYGIMYSKYNGSSWSEPQLLSHLSGGYVSYYLSIGADDFVAVAYTFGPNDCRNQEIHLALSEDGGVGWYSPVIVSKVDGIGSRWPSLAVVALDNIQIIWEECGMSVPFRFFNGANWSEIIDLGGGNLKSQMPNIFALLDKSYAVWGSGEADGEIYFSQTK